MKRFFQSLIRGYQKGVSPHFPSSCRFYPSCSNYGMQALEQHGVVKGSLMTGARILRCNPFVKGGPDPVPDHFSLKRNTNLTEEDRKNYAAYITKHF